MLEKSMANDHSQFPKSESYFILREGKNYEDKTGKEYHFRSGIPGSKQLPAALADGKRVPFYQKQSVGTIIIIECSQTMGG